MGSIIKASYECGFESELLFVGSGFLDMNHIQDALHAEIKLSFIVTHVGNAPDLGDIMCCKYNGRPALIPDAFDDFLCLSLCFQKHNIFI